jgi:hypothetical protein
MTFPPSDFLMVESACFSINCPPSPWSVCGEAERLDGEEVQPQSESQWPS